MRAGETRNSLNACYICDMCIIIVRSQNGIPRIPNIRVMAIHNPYYTVMCFIMLNYYIDIIEANLARYIIHVHIDRISRHNNISCAMDWDVIPSL